MGSFLRRREIMNLVNQIPVLFRLANRSQEQTLNVDDLMKEKPDEFMKLIKNNAHLSLFQSVLEKNQRVDPMIQKQSIMKP